MQCNDAIEGQRRDSFELRLLNISVDDLQMLQSIFQITLLGKQRKNTLASHN
jgi:hypothetical protein